MLTCASRSFSWGSLNIVHQSPRSVPSWGVAVFQLEGSGSLKAGGTGAVGVLYLGPTLQPQTRPIRQSTVVVFSHGLNGFNGFNPLNPFNPWLKMFFIPHLARESGIASGVTVLTAGRG